MGYSVSERKKMSLIEGHLSLDTGCCLPDCVSKAGLLVCNRLLVIKTNFKPETLNSEL
jgi:hypothetical protein